MPVSEHDTDLAESALSAAMNAGCDEAERLGYGGELGYAEAASISEAAVRGYLEATGDVDRASRLRMMSRRLHDLAEAMLDEAQAIERAAWGPDVLRGGELADAAFDVVAASDEPLHYRHIAAAVMTRTGRRINGREPEATLLAQISRDPRFVVARPRSGLYAVRPGGRNDG